MKKILRDNSETGGFLIEPVRIFECFLGQRNSKHSNKVLTVPFSKMEKAAYQF